MNASDSNPANLVGRVISLSSGDGTKQHCTVLFPDGREATFNNKNLEIVKIDGTGLVGMMDVAEAESALWERLNAAVTAAATLAVSNAVLIVCQALL